MVNSTLVGLDQKCPHCGREVQYKAAEQKFPTEVEWGGDYSLLVASGENESVSVHSALCPSCKRPVLQLFYGTFKDGKVTSSHLVYPRNASRYIPPEVPPTIKADFQEAVEVLPISQKASAALSRRCLQSVLIDKGGVISSDVLSKQIDTVMPKLPTHIAEDLDAIRNIGNFAAHPMKDSNTGQIVDVEVGEAVWNLDVLEELFDHYYVKPSQSAKKRQALDAKLQAAGKPPMKKT
jgi:endogenous inhibitor of DNA gyrase (YacG/DUF329 family)